jgi:hypothetical protein
MALSQERRGENEAFFRELNERLETHAFEKGASGEPSFRAVCECATEECTVRLRISLGEYERVRDDARRFIVARGHGDMRFESVVRSSRDYDVVEKFGEAGQVAVRSDPRS